MSPNNIDINNNYNDNNNSNNNNKGLCNFIFPLISANFEGFRCGAYLRAAFRRGRCLCQRKKNYANDTLKLSHCLFPNNYGQLLLCVFTYSRATSYFHCFFVGILVAYAFYFSCGQIMVRFLISHLTFKQSAYQREALIRGRHLF